MKTVISARFLKTNSSPELKKKGDKCMGVCTELKPEGQTFSVYVPKLSVFLFINRIFLTFFSPFPAFTDHLRIG